MRVRTNKWIVASILLVLIGALVWWTLAAEPTYKKRRISKWVTEFSPDLYPGKGVQNWTGKYPTPNEEGMAALLDMGPKLASRALWIAGKPDSKLQEWYRKTHPKLPSFIAKHFPPGLPESFRLGMTLAAADELPAEYQRLIARPLFKLFRKSEGEDREYAALLLGIMSISQTERRVFLPDATDRELHAIAISGVAAKTRLLTDRGFKIWVPE